MPVTGLTSSLISRDRLISSLLVGLVVGVVMSVPLPSLHLSVVKTATAKRVAEGVWTAAAVAAVLSLLNVDNRSLISVAIGLVALWATLAISVSVRPLAISDHDVDGDAVSWLPIPRRSALATKGKRVFDVIVSMLALIVVGPVLLAVAACIKASDRGPVMFKQQRVGKDGVPFEMLKFRSMVVNAEELKADLADSSERSGPLFKISKDPRITPIGRIIRELSIDELPQLINILRGDMSLVGPRPALPGEAAQFDAALQRRTTVTPGLTGLWQAEARADADFDRFRDLDLRYVSNASPALDLWIILATATDVGMSVVAGPLRAAGLEIGRSDGIDLRDGATDDVVIDLRTPTSTDDDPYTTSTVA